MSQSCKKPSFTKLDSFVFPHPIPLEEISSFLHSILVLRQWAGQGTTFRHVGDVTVLALRDIVIW